MITLRGLRFGWPGRPPVLDGLDLSLAAGERVTLQGPNGAGKSTLLKLMLGLLRPQAGVIAAFGVACEKEKDFRALRRRVGLLFQDPDDQLFCPTVADDVAFGPRNLGHGREAAQNIAIAQLEALGVAHLRDRVTHHLSGGEKRLVALAGVLAMAPEVLLLDEPTNALDPENAARMTALLTALPQTMLAISHDADFRAQLGGRALILSHGRLQPQGRVLS